MSQPTNRSVFRNVNALVTPMPETVRVVIDGKEVVNDLRAAGVFSQRLSLSTNPSPVTYTVNGDNGTVPLAAAHGNLVLDVYESEIVNDASASDAIFASFQEFMGKYRNNIPRPLKRAASNGLIPVYRVRYSPASTGGKKKRAFVPLGLLAGFSTNSRHGMSFENDDRFFWPVKVTEKGADNTTVDRVVAVIFGAIDADDPIGGFKKGKHRVVIMEVDSGMSMSPLDALSFAVFDSGWLESDSALLESRFPGFKPEAKSAGEYKVERGKASTDDDDSEADFKGRERGSKKPVRKAEEKVQKPEPTEAAALNAPCYRWCTKSDCGIYHHAIWGTSIECAGCGNRIGPGRTGKAWEKAIQKDVDSRGSDPRTAAPEPPAEAPAAT